MLSTEKLRSRVFWRSIGKLYIPTRQIYRLSAVFLLLSILLFLSVVRPAQSKLSSLQREKVEWQSRINLENRESVSASIPSLEDLPDIIEKCREAFRQDKVNVTAFNIEKFGQTPVKFAELDYALLRLHLKGDWKGMLNALNFIENRPDLAIHIQEVALHPQGGDILLQIYFKARD